MVWNSKACVIQFHEPVSTDTTTDEVMVESAPQSRPCRAGLSVEDGRWAWEALPPKEFRKAQALVG